MHLKTPFASLLALCLLGPAAAADGDGAPYRVDVWSSVIFGPDGKASSYTVKNESELPGPFAAAVKKRLGAARVEPRLRDGKPATYRTGVRMEFEITRTPQGGVVRMSALEMAPFPLRTYYAPPPPDIAATEGWHGSVTATCIVSTAGRCGPVAVKMAPGLQESARQFAKASLERWEFEPQMLDDVAIEGEYTLQIDLKTVGSAPEDFRQDKLGRVLKGRN